MDTHIREIKEIEIGQLNLRYALTRIERPKESLALTASLERAGQIIPVIVVKEEMTFVLLDGYLRVKALRRAGSDTVMAEVWECKEEEALVQILARGRKWDRLEEAALLKELHEHCNLSQERIAAMVGRTQGSGSPGDWPFITPSPKTSWNSSERGRSPHGPPCG